MTRISSRSGILGKLASLAFAAAVVAVFVFSYRHRLTPGVGRDGSEPLVLGSSSFLQGRIPAAFTCDGADTSPALSWSAPPPGTRTFALLLYDRDAPSGSFVHWVLINVPSETRSLPEALPALAQLADGSMQGRNDFDRIGYGGPCPPDHGVHRYVFSLLALDTALNFAPGEPITQLEEATQGHVLAHGTLVATYNH